MAIVTAAHIKLSWGGTLGVPATEVWTNSLAFTGVTDVDSQLYSRDDLVTMMGAVQTAVSAWFSRPESLITPAAHLTWIKLNKIGVDGKYIDNPNTVEFAAVPGGSSSYNLWQQSTVISFLTGQARGRGSRGRVYPPMCGTAPQPDGFMTQASCDGMQTSAVTLLGDLNHIDPGTNVRHPTPPKWNACIVSNAAAGKPAILTPITRLYVDRIPDVQRRRVNRLKATGVAPTTVYINT